ncbi:MAG: hypothetical protein L7S56_04385 [Candidatus Poseidonia sp.]|nr:hypothetical protein [Poseidonia sp.]
MEHKNLEEEEDTLAAIGIGAMIVFIALILVAAVAAAVIIQTAEKLQQNAQKTGDDTAKQSTSRFMVNGGVLSAANTFMLFVKLAPGSTAVTNTDIIAQLGCAAGNENIDANNIAIYTMDTASAATPAITNVAPAVGYAMVISAATCTTGTITMMLHIEGSGSTYQVLEVPATVGQPII